MRRATTGKAGQTAQRGRPKRSGLDDAQSNGAERYLSKAIGRALDVLDLFPDEQCRLNLKEISSCTSLPESSLFRILLTLENRGYLLMDSVGCYRLAPRV